MDTQENDWRYSSDRMELRQQVLSILLKEFGGEINNDGSPVYSNESIYGCTHDWVSHGNSKSDGIVAYYKSYYSTL